MGCQMNEYDSEKMADVLRESHGYELTDSPDDADLLLVNTCSIREKAQEKVFSELGRWKQLKQKNPNVKIGVGGCVASQEGAEIQISDGALLHSECHGFCEGGGTPSKPQVSFRRGDPSRQLQVPFRQGSEDAPGIHRGPAQSGREEIDFP